MLFDTAMISSRERDFNSFVCVQKVCYAYKHKECATVFIRTKFAANWTGNVENACKQSAFFGGSKEDELDEPRICNNCNSCFMIRVICKHSETQRLESPAQRAEHTF